MTRRPPFFIRLMLAAIRGIGVVVPRRDRAAWRREWEAEIVHGHLTLAREGRDTWSDHMRLARRASASVSDAAWLRRQFTRDSDLVHDLRHTLRLYRRSPGMVGLVVAVLAVGIGATTAVFSAVDAVLLKPVPFADADRLVTIWQQSPESEKADVAPANFLDWRDRAREFDVLAAAEPYSRDFTSGAEPEIFQGARVTEGFFDALRVEPQHGRLLTADDYRLKRNVAVLADGIWKRRFGGSPAIVGQSIRLDTEMFEIVGVLPAGYEPKILDGRGRPDVWTAKTALEDYEKESRTGGYWHVVGRVKAGSTAERAQAELDAISVQLAKEHPRTNTNVRAQALSMRAHLAGGAERPLALLGVGSLFILLLALGSVVNLQLSLLTARLQEFAVRTALGAHRPRLVRQVFVESGTIAAIAVALGIALAAGFLAAIRAVSPEALEIAGGARLNLPVLAFAAGLGLLAATLAAVLPVLTILRSEAATGVHGALSVRGQVPALYGRSALVVVQIALAVVLLVSAGLIGRSFVRLLQVDAGLNTQNLLAVQVFAYDRNETAAKRIAFFANTVDRIRLLPGVDSVGAASTVPFLNADIDIGSPLLIQGRAISPDDAPRVFLTATTPGYFTTAGIALRRGRLFTPDDRMDTRGVAIVNETAWRANWPGADPVGQTIVVTDAGRKKTMEVIGIVADLRYGGLEGSPRPEVFLPHAQSAQAAMTYVIRTAMDPSAMIGAIKQAVWSVDPLQTFYEAGAVTDMIDTSLRPRVFALRLVIIFAGVGFVLAVAGSYGAVAWALRRRTTEFGVRLALGATGTDIRRHMLAYAARLAVAGIAIGLVAALLLGGALRALLFEVRAADPVTLIGVAVGLFLAVAAAAYLPARRAGRIDPVVALRH
jgi:putative ABC transport system permease protein